ncbi:DEAD/DEAH box helicase [Streptomyces sp. NEAU-NA10]|uniref:DEAD/DEAH box helicase n=1 Tax=Streptomyces sp. NEAU-NA10 TaxID=3416050 RepID=UPI003CC6A9BF
MHLRTVDVPGSLVLFPSPSLDSKLRGLRADHPYLPDDVHALATDLDSREGGVPATIEEPRDDAAKDPCLLVHGRTYVARLYLNRRKRDAYEVGSIQPLGLERHHGVAQGCLLVRPVRWQPCHLRGETPPNSEAHWGLLEAEWRRFVDERAARNRASALAARHDDFLTGVEQVIDAGERIAVARASAAEDFPYRDVSATGERRHGTRAVHVFHLVGDSRPDEGAFVDVRGEPGLRGRVVRAPAHGTSVTVSFDRAVSWDSVPKQGALLVTAGRAVHDRQREAVRTLRDRRSNNPHLLDVLVDHSTRPLTPASAEPDEELDPEQTEAFRKALTTDDLLVVLGPPGTGKTRTISQIARTIAASRTGARVLVASHTNRAVDNVLSRLPEDLVVVRVGNENAVTAEGRPYLLDEQAAGLRRGVLDRLETTLARPFEGEAAEKWCHELGLHLGRLRTLQAEESAGRRSLDEARRAVGGAAQHRVAELLAEGSRLAGEQSRAAHRIERLTRARRTALRRAGWRFIGIVFRPSARRGERRLAAAAAAATALDHDYARNRAQLQEAERALDAATRDIPPVREARAALEAVRARGAACRTAAFTAAGRCRAAVAGVEETPVVSDPETTEPDTVDRELAALHGWLTERLPLLASRRALLTEWHDEVSSATGQLHTELIRYAHVVAATCIGVASRPELSGLDFDLAVVDEAGQIAVPDALVPLVRARRAVLVGDHRQLPPHLDPEVREWAADTGDPVLLDLVTTSVLELLCARLPEAGTVALTNQRRMPSVVADFVSAAFYGGQLRTPVPDGPHDSRLFGAPMAFVDTSRLPLGGRSEQEAVSAAGQERAGYVNPAEAELLTLLAAHYDERGEQWAVIVPYAAQAELITEALTLRTGRPRHVRLNVGTVDSFQGGERDVILYGFTRSNPAGRVGFLAELRRTNVAFTRARRQLVLVGDLATLTRATDSGFRELMRSLREHVAARGEIRAYDDVRALVERIGAGGDRS